MPEHLILTISQISFQRNSDKPQTAPIFKGSSIALMDEIISHPKMMPSFLGTHVYSIPIL
jgi:hypothetical protein